MSQRGTGDEAGTAADPIAICEPAPDDVERCDTVRNELEDSRRRRIEIRIHMKHLEPDVAARVSRKPGDGAASIVPAKSRQTHWSGIPTHDERRVCRACYGREGGGDCIKPAFFAEA